VAYKPAVWGQSKVLEGRVEDRVRERGTVVSMSATDMGERGRLVSSGVVNGVPEGGARFGASLDGVTWMVRVVVEEAAVASVKVKSRVLVVVSWGEGV